MEELLDLAVLGELDNDAFEDGILYELNRGRRRKFVRSAKYGRFNLNALSTDECLAYFRFEKEHLLRLAVCLDLPPEIRSQDHHAVSGGFLSELCDVILYLV